MEVSTRVIWPNIEEGGGHGQETQSGNPTKYEVVTETEGREIKWLNRAGYSKTRRAYVMRTTRNRQEDIATERMMLRAKTMRWWKAMKSKRRRKKKRKRRKNGRVEERR
jgi:hypothetical protein